MGPAYTAPVASPCQSPGLSPGSDLSPVQPGDDPGEAAAAAAAAAVAFPDGAATVMGVWTLGLGLLGDSESSLNTSFCCSSLLFAYTYYYRDTYVY